jgi:hypothetical protein
METFDGVLHKTNIIDNEEYALIKTKNQMVFSMTSSDREFLISTKDAQSINYDVIDRIIRAICVDTRRTTQVYHHLINKQ